MVNQEVLYVIIALFCSLRLLQGDVYEKDAGILSVLIVFMMLGLFLPRHSRGPLEMKN